MTAPTRIDGEDDDLQSPGGDRTVTFDKVGIDTEVFQNGIPAAYLTPGTREPIIVWAGPDGCQRPLRVRYTFARCRECRALVLPGDDENDHTAWHARQAGGNPS